MHFGSLRRSEYCIYRRKYTQNDHTNLFYYNYYYYFFISWDSLSFMEKLKGTIDITMYLLSSHLHKVKVFVAQLCPALCNSMDCSPPGSSVHGTLQARILEWVAFPFSRGSSQPRNRTQASRIASRFFTCLSHQGSYTSITSPTVNIPHTSFGITHETTLTYYNHPKPIVCIMYSTKRENWCCTLYTVLTNV